MSKWLYKSHLKTTIFLPLKKKIKHVYRVNANIDATNFLSIYQLFTCLSIKNKTTYLNRYFTHGRKSVNCDTIVFPSLIKKKNWQQIIMKTYVWNTEKKYAHTDFPILCAFFHIWWWGWKLFMRYNFIFDLFKYLFYWNWRGFIVFSNAEVLQSHNFISFPINLGEKSIENNPVLQYEGLTNVNLWSWPLSCAYLRKCSPNFL